MISYVELSHKSSEYDSIYNALDDQTGILTVFDITWRFFGISELFLLFHIFLKPKHASWHQRHADLFISRTTVFKLEQTFKLWRQ